MALMYTLCVSTALYNQTCGSSTFFVECSFCCALRQRLTRQHAWSFWPAVERGTLRILPVVPIVPCQLRARACVFCLLSLCRWCPMIFHWTWSTKLQPTKCKKNKHLVGANLLVLKPTKLSSRSKRMLAVMASDTVIRLATKEVTKSVWGLL